MCVCVCARFFIFVVEFIVVFPQVLCFRCPRRRRFFLFFSDVSILPFSSQISQQNLPKHCNAEEYGCDFLLLLSFDAKDPSSRVCFFLCEKNFV